MTRRREILTLPMFRRPRARSSIPITTVPREAVEALVAHLQGELSMQIEHDKTIPAGPENPEDQAHEAVDAMQASRGHMPTVDRALLAAGRGHARVLEKINEPEPRE